MTKPARAAAEIEKVRESIIESAVGLIAAGGFAGMTMRRLAVKMEMSATNLYNYFRSKDEIYITILIRGFRDLYDRLHRARDRARDPVEQAKAVVSEYLSFGIDNFNYYDIMFSPSLPKYNDYMGTPYEALSRIEMDYSRKIIDLAMDMVSAVLESSPETERAAAERYMIEVWSMLHGMILLQNSTLATYVVSDPMKVYAHIVDDIIRVIKR